MLQIHLRIHLFLFFYVIMKRLTITEISAVETRNVVVNPEPRPVKSFSVLSNPSLNLSKLLILVTFLPPKDLALDVGLLTTSDPMAKLVAVLLTFYKRWYARFEIVLLVSQIGFLGLVLLYFA